MSKQQKFFNWATLLALVLIFVAGFAALMIVGAVIAQSMPFLGAWMMLTGFASLVGAFASLRMMELYA